MFESTYSFCRDLFFHDMKLCFVPLLCSVALFLCRVFFLNWVLTLCWDFSAFCRFCWFFWVVSAHSVVTFNPSTLCWVLLGSHSALLGTVLFLYRILSVFFMHDGFYRFVGRVLQSSRSCTFVWIFHFPGFCFHARKLRKASQLYHWFSPANHSIFTGFPLIQLPLAFSKHSFRHLSAKLRGQHSVVSC